MAERSSTGFEQLTGVFEARPALRVAAQHAGKLLNPCIACYNTNRSASPSGTHGFLDDDLVIRARRDLSEVCDNEDLVLLCNVMQPLSDLVGDASADSHIDFVEHE
jgi:hypothetical protein